MLSLEQLQASTINLSVAREAYIQVDPHLLDVLDVRKSFEQKAATLYQVPEIVTLGRFPEEGESDSTWRTQEVRHVGSDTIAPGFWCVTAAGFGEEDERRSAGPSAAGACGDL